jgi:hypothetical protein
MLSLLSLSVRKMISRVLFCGIMIALYMIAGRMPGGSPANTNYEGQMIGGAVGIHAVDVGIGR